MIEYICWTCGKDLLVKGRKSKRYRYCSKICQKKMRNGVADFTNNKIKK